MKTAIACCVFVAMAVGCGSSTTGTGPGGGASSSSGSATPAETGCEDIVGNYDVKVTRISGDCPEPESGPTSQASITIASESDELFVVLPGISGGCKGTLDAESCHFQAQCEIIENGVKAVTYNVDYTFAGKTMTGSLVGAAAAGVLSDNACTATSKHEGVRL